MAKAISTEEVAAVIHTDIARTLKTIAKLNRSEEGNEAIPGVIETLTEAVKKMEALLEKL
jgi:GTP cyclohydrolase III